MVNKELLLQEIRNLKLQEANLLAEANAANGAIRAYEALVMKIENEEKEEIESKEE